MTSFEDVIFIGSDHPSLAGHFPDNPVVPGALVIDEIVAIVERHRQWRICGVARVKFHAPVPVDRDCDLHASREEDGKVVVACSVEGKPVLKAVFDCDPSIEVQ